MEPDREIPLRSTAPQKNKNKAINQARPHPYNLAPIRAGHWYTKYPDASLPCLQITPKRRQNSKETLNSLQARSLPSARSRTLPSLFFSGCAKVLSCNQGKHEQVVVLWQVGLEIPDLSLPTAFPISTVCRYLHPTCDWVGQIPADTCTLQVIQWGRYLHPTCDSVGQIPAPYTIHRFILCLEERRKRERRKGGGEISLWYSGGKEDTISLRGMEERRGGKEETNLSVQGVAYNLRQFSAQVCRGVAYNLRQVSAQVYRGVAYNLRQGVAYNLRQVSAQVCRGVAYNLRQFSAQVCRVWPSLGAQLPPHAALPLNINTNSPNTATTTKLTARDKYSLELCSSPGTLTASPIVLDTVQTQRLREGTPHTLKPCDLAKHQGHQDSP
ncbi:hypothetical protein JZ751_018942 [Albula glossodonta]|uniref:Uncharacterized protein n=1 Tax=Albula glossodonta TaxID=121402 RepID=A0A8T2MUX1_9TELE|nr:hypothetical protein JZ751_018942 [Albula glossodonta]